MVSHKKQQRAVGWWVGIGVVGGLVLVAIGLVTTAIYWTPERILQKKMETMAVDYYENYFYDKLIDTTAEEGVGGLARYQITGLAPVPLKQLLVFEEGRWSKMKADFNNEKNNCDELKTTVQFFPVAPYNRGDYTIKYKISCIFL